MDVVSDAITAMRTGRPSARRARVPAPWRLSFPAYSGAGFHIVLRTGCLLLPERGGPVPLGVGDIVFFPRGSAHELADARLGAAGPRRPAVRFDAWDGPAGGSPDAVGTGFGTGTGSGAGPEAGPEADDPDGCATELLCGKYRMDRSRAHPLLAELPDVVHLPCRVGEDQDLRAAVDLLGRETGAPRTGFDVALPGLLDLLLVYILRAWHDRRTAAGDATGWSRALADPVVGGALRAVHTDPAHPWTVPELATRAGLSRAAFARRFAALVGRPPLAYLTWWRMTVAARLLREPGRGLAGVAHAVGYTSEYAFAHAFKREFGTAPGQYRDTAAGRRAPEDPTVGDPEPVMLPAPGRGGTAGTAAPRPGTSSDR